VNKLSSISRLIVSKHHHATLDALESWKGALDRVPERRAIGLVPIRLVQSTVNVCKEACVIADDGDANTPAEAAREQGYWVTCCLGPELEGDPFVNSNFDASDHRGRLDKPFDVLLVQKNVADATAVIVPPRFEAK